MLKYILATLLFSGAILPDTPASLGKCFINKDASESSSSVNLENKGFHVNNDVEKGVVSLRNLYTIIGGCVYDIELYEFNRIVFQNGTAFDIVDGNFRYNSNYRNPKNLITVKSPYISGKSAVVSRLIEVSSSGNKYLGLWRTDKNRSVLATFVDQKSKPHVVMRIDGKVSNISFNNSLDSASGSIGVLLKNEEIAKVYSVTWYYGSWKW